MKKPTSDQKKPLTQGRNTQRKRGRRVPARIIPSPRARLLDDVVNEERKERIRQRIAWIQKNGTPLERLTVSVFIQSMVQIIRDKQRRARRQFAAE